MKQIVPTMNFFVPYPGIQITYDDSWFPLQGPPSYGGVLSQRERDVVFRGLVQYHYLGVS